MPLDPSIALQVQSPNPANFISGFLDLGSKKLALDKAKDTYSADIARSKADSSTAQSAATVNAANVQPLIQQQAAQTDQSQTQARLAKYKLTGEQAQKGAELATGLATDPDFVKGNTDGMLQKLNNVQTIMTTQFGIDPAIADATVTSLKYQALHNPGAVVQSLQNMIKGSLGAQGQASAMYPAPALLNTGGTVQPTAAANPALTGVQPGTPQGAATPLTLAPGQQTTVANDNVGNPYTINRNPRGDVVGSAPLPAGGPQVIPPNETIQTRDQLQGERTAAQNAATNAGVAHQLNREIAQEADKGFATGTLGAITQKLASATGFKIGDGAATDYNVLGKMLERSALNAAQGMGPHTNAGLEASVRANGSLDYTPQAIKKIATLNDALTTGQQLYQQGLENAIKQNGIFGKRQFDQQWGKTFDAQGIDAMQFKNAVDGGDQSEIAAVLRKVGGKDSPMARRLFKKLQDLDQLAGQ